MILESYHFSSEYNLFSFYSLYPWKSKKLKPFLKKLELDSYVDIFKKNELDLKLLQDLTDSGLKEALWDLD